LSEVSEELCTSDDRYNEAEWRRLRAHVAADVGFLDDAALAWLDLAEILRTAGNENAADAAGEALACSNAKATSSAWDGRGRRSTPSSLTELPEAATGPDMLTRR
jgi:hypothetical protein